MTTAQRPKYPHNMTPELILGRRYEAFAAFFKSCRANKETGYKAPRDEDQSAYLKQCIDDLHRFGFVPGSIDEHGRIKWEIITESGSDDLFRRGEYKNLPTLGELERMDSADLMRFARSRYRAMMSEMSKE